MPSSKQAIVLSYVVYNNITLIWIEMVLHFFRTCAHSRGNFLVFIKVLYQYAAFKLRK